jgi:hypothetical protein
MCSVEVGLVRAFVKYVPDDAFDGGVEFIAGVTPPNYLALILANLPKNRHYYMSRELAKLRRHYKNNSLSLR